MSRLRKKKELSLIEELKERDLLEEGESVDIPDLENEDLIEENSLSVMVRCLNPAVHKVGGLVKALPPIWDLEYRVRGRGVSEHRVQFIFQCEKDFSFVLTKGPWFGNGWIVAVDQWTPNPRPDFLNQISFWIRIKGLLIHLLKKQAVESIISPLDKPLQFRKLAQFSTGEQIWTELTYEKLLKVCFLYKRLTHDQEGCPYNVAEVRSDVREERQLRRVAKEAAKDLGK
ncbi:uncharacterized protein LOC18021833 [Eutrema salsugineum]|uniref:uncharacterized protein LOC18021833 n=1 Tax=Eutrema salsugineum TaxID=72664 RepID=UPI000CED4B2F|nr:uncharacterized protein LOC18021833 [Eutrema salsugineum]